jgi:carbon storage regulator
MLVLQRRVNGKISIGKNIEITVVEIKGDRIKLGISAPTDVEIVRDDAVKKERVNSRSGCCGKSSGQCKGGCHHG